MEDHTDILSWITDSVTLTARITTSTTTTTSTANLTEFNPVQRQLLSCHCPQCPEPDFLQQHKDVLWSGFSGHFRLKYRLDSDFIPRNSKKSKSRKSDLKF